MKAQYDLAQNGAAREGLNFEEISRLSFAYPPTQKEREEISTSLAAKSGKLVDAIRAATEMTDLLRERRTALISAAVTGKIDVRGWKPPAADPKKETEMEVA
jgi:type I restriction enzyme S subunit